MAVKALERHLQKAEKLAQHHQHVSTQLDNAADAIQIHKADLMAGRIPREYKFDVHETNVIANLSAMHQLYAGLKGFLSMMIAITSVYPVVGVIGTGYAVKQGVGVMHNVRKNAFKANIAKATVQAVADLAPRKISKRVEYYEAAVKEIRALAREHGLHAEDFRGIAKLLKR